LLKWAGGALVCPRSCSERATVTSRRGG
jgi:hypothetical protein